MTEYGTLCSIVNTTNLGVKNINEVMEDLVRLVEYGEPIESFRPQAAELTRLAYEFLGRAEAIAVFAGKSREDVARDSGCCGNCEE